MSITAILRAADGSLGSANDESDIALIPIVEEESNENLFEGDGAEADEALSAAAEDAESAVDEATGDELDGYVEKADAYIEATRGTGEFGKFTAPFSRQFKTTLKTYFPEDDLSFDAIDIAEEVTNLTAIKMRFNTYIFYLIFSLLYFSLSVSLIPLSGVALGPMVSNVVGAVLGALASVDEAMGGFGFLGDGRIAPFSYFPVLIIIFFVLLWVRFQIRDYFFNKIENNVSTMALRVSSELSAIGQLVTNALESVDQDRTPEDEWPERAGKWTKVALWGEERYQNIDRYLAATSWRVEDRFHWISYFFMSLNAVTALASIGGVTAVAFVASDAGGGVMPWISLAAGAVIYFFLVIFVWTIGLDRGNNFWRTELSKRFSEAERGRVHMFNRIGNKMRTDKNEILRRRI